MQKGCVKKSLRWTCKACGEKQSFLRAYGEGSGAHCRSHVQKLNLLQGQASELLPRGYSHSAAQLPRGPDAQDASDAGVALESQDNGDLRGAAQRGSPGCPWRATAPPSKWARFLLPPVHSPQEDTEPLASAQRGPGPARPAQATPEEGRFSGPTAPTMPPRAVLGRPCGETPWAEGCQVAPSVRRCSLFTTGEEFEDDL
ncbi:MRN complex-interacting protein [Fukomys damarensis]|uniref:MRN complex-interacting protein n=1 Tax=Fukomys damarensis TaxID=885580 RepID=UPI0005401E09|nr:MRN complex-interacting protein [Fukomys damarensis]